MQFSEQRPNPNVIQGSLQNSIFRTSEQGHRLSDQRFSGNGNQEGNTMQYPERCVGPDVSSANTAVMQNMGSDRFMRQHVQSYLKMSNEDNSHARAMTAVVNHRTAITATISHQQDETDGIDEEERHVMKQKMN